MELCGMGVKVSGVLGWKVFYLEGYLKRVVGFFGGGKLSYDLKLRNRLRFRGREYNGKDIELRIIICASE